MESFLAKIAWKMNIIAPGSPIHIGILLLTVLLALGVYRMAETSNLNLPAMGFLLLLMEILKQIFLTYVRGWNYSWSDFPFQLCSIPMYLMLIYPLLKEHGRRIVESYLMSFGLIGGMAALIEPVSIFSDYVLLTVHSLVWHVLLVLIGVWMIANRKDAPGKENDIEENNIEENNIKEVGIKGAGIKETGIKETGIKETGRRNIRPNLKKCLREYVSGVGLLYLCLAASAVLINTCLARISGGTANMFFLGPSWPDMYILNDVYNHCGWEAETLLFMAVTWSAGLEVSILEHLY